MLAAIGETFETPLPKEGEETPVPAESDLVTGVIVSARPVFYRIAIWTRNAPDTTLTEEDPLVKRIMTIGRHFKASVLGYDADQKLVASSLQSEITFESHKGESEHEVWADGRFREEGQQEQAHRVDVNPDTISSLYIGFISFASMAPSCVYVQSYMRYMHRLTRTSDTTANGRTDERTDTTTQPKSTPPVRYPVYTRNHPSTLARHIKHFAPPTSPRPLKSSRPSSVRVADIAASLGFS